MECHEIFTCGCVCTCVGCVSVIVGVYMCVIVGVYVSGVPRD